MPERIQRKRTKGWRMPEGAVYVGRPTKWGNPFRPQRTPERLDGFGRWCVIDENDVDYWPAIDTAYGAAAQAVELYETYVCDPRLGGSLSHDAITAALAGRALACWCPLDQPCHADVLLEIANRECHGAEGER